MIVWTWVVIVDRHKWMKLSCFRDGADKGLVCEAENPDFFLSN